jgi:hypothetical protein
MVASMIHLCYIIEYPRYLYEFLYYISLSFRAENNLDPDQRIF